MSQDKACEIGQNMQNGEGDKLSLLIPESAISRDSRSSSCDDNEDSFRELKVDKLDAFIKSHIKETISYSSSGFDRHEDAQFPEPVEIVKFDDFEDDEHSFEEEIINQTYFKVKNTVSYSEELPCEEASKSCMLPLVNNSLVSDEEENGNHECSESSLERPKFPLSLNKLKKITNHQSAYINILDMEQSKLINTEEKMFRQKQFFTCELPLETQSETARKNTKVEET
jgi:hypothetical protein